MLRQNTEPVFPATEKKKSNFIQNFRYYLKRPKTYFVLVAFLLLVGAVIFYQKVILHEEISQFELTPKIFDSAGITPSTSFILKSTADLSETVIEKYLKFSPQVEYSAKKISAMTPTYEIIPNVSLATDTVYSIAIAEGPIAEHTYSWAYQVKAPFQIIGTLPRDKASGVPVNTGIEITFNRENIINPGNSFEISPAVPGRFEVRRNVLVFIPTEPLLEKTVYSIKIKPGIKISGSDDSLATDKEVQFETTEKYSYLEPQFNFDKTFWEKNPGEEISFEVSASYLKGDVPLSVYKFNNLQEFVDTYKTTVSLENAWTRFHSYKPVKISDDKKYLTTSVPVESQAYVEFVRLPQKLPEGFYLIDSFVNNEHSQAWLQVTPIATFSAVGGVKTLFWLKNLENGNNVSNADVSFENKNLGKTNNDGVIVVATPSRVVQSAGDPYYYYSTSPTDLFVVNAGSRQIAIPIENEYGYVSKVSPASKWWDYLSLDKTIYLPTDKLHFWGIIKQRNGADIKGEEITLQLTSPYWEETPQENITVYGETKAKISDFYTLTGEIGFANLKPGLYQLSAKRGNETIVMETVDVEAYVKPAYKLILEADKNAIFVGDTVTYKVSAKFFDNTPVSNMKIEYNGYFDENITGEVQLDQDGEATFAVRLNYSESEYDNYWPRYFGIRVSPAVAEEGEINTNLSTLVFGPHMNLRINESYGKNKDKFGLSLRSIILNKINNGAPGWNSENYLGGSVSGWPIGVAVEEIINIKTQTGTKYDAVNKTTYPVYKYSTEYKPIISTSLATDGAGNAYYEWAPERGKSYRIIFTIKDADGRKITRTVYSYGASSSYFDSYESTGIVLKNLTAEQLKVGDAINFKIQGYGGKEVPSGANKFLFVKTTNGDVSYQITDSPDYVDTFKDAYIPNVNLLGVWFQENHFSTTYPSNVSFDSEERRLNISVTRDKERYRPGEKVNLSFQVTDKNNTPKQAEINVSGIDEAVFSLNPEERDITSVLYQDIFSFLITRSSHTTPIISGAEKGGCFVGGTKILTPGGNVAIENLRVGDEILTREGDFSSSFVRAKIKKISSHLADGYFVINDNLKVTANHRLSVNNTWKHAGEIQINDILLTSVNKQEKVKSLKFIAEWGLVYNIELETLHTFFANGIYVHNEEKGGGGIRSDFKDVAVYKSIQTDASGRASLLFNVPDNITSWRITSQAVTKDFFAGKNISSIPVGIPFFVDATLNKTYLAGDNLNLRVRTFGTANIKNNINYVIESETLPFKKIIKTGDNVIEIPLGILPAGTHKIKISANSGSNNDAIIRDLNVETSYFTQKKADFYELSSSLSGIAGATNGYTTLTFSSYERGRFYPALKSIAGAYGVRVDQKMSQWFAKNYLNKFFGENNEIGDFDPMAYQVSNGGIALLPYSDADLELSAKLANLINQNSLGSNSSALKDYLNSSLTDDYADLSREVIALYGLSSFKAPVLIALQNIKTNSNLSLVDKIYIALALNNLGAKEDARNYYRTNIKPTLTTKLPYIYESKLTGSDNNLIATALLAGLASSLSEPEADGLGKYAMENYPKETLKNFEMLLYFNNSLQSLKAGPVSFTYQTSKTKFKKNLEKNETFRLVLSSEELTTLKFSDVSGRIGMVSVYEASSTPAVAKKDASLSVARHYSVNGVQTREFKDGDLVRIDINPSFSSKALSGMYQVVDYLPSGLRAVTGPGMVPFNDAYQGSHYYPSDVEDQKVTFLVSKYYARPFFYYARVVSKGNYKAEPVLIQSLKSLESTNISTEDIVIIQ